MIARTGAALLWKVPPFCGSVMVKGWTESGLIELYHMNSDLFFSVAPDVFTQCRTLTFKDETLRLINPAQWEIQSAIWARAYVRCGVPAT